METKYAMTNEQQLQSLVDQAVAGWNAGDGHAYAAAFEEDADYVTFGGVHTHGRQAIAIDHQQLFDTFLRGSRLQLQIEALRFLSPEIALGHIVGGILDEPGQTELRPERRSMQVAVFRKTGTTWQITSSQVTRMQPPQPGFNIPARTSAS